MSQIEGARENLREQVKMYFEYFKHLTTLNTATAVIVLALGLQMGSEPQQTGGIVFLLLVLSLVPSLVGMYSSMSLIGSGRTTSNRVRILRFLLFMASASFVLFLLLLMLAFAVFALGSLEILVVFLFVLLVVVLAYFIIRP